MSQTKASNTTSKSPESILQSVWGYTEFRSPQKEIVEAVLQQKHTFVSMPTGGGKSLCYQVPVLCGDGVGIVISPLVALMKDQIANLKKVGIKATDLSSGLHADEITQRIDNCIHGNYRFLFLSPERLSSERIQEQLQNLKVSLLVIDEAHCISQWGHDFRPSYLKVHRLIELFPDTPVICLTASATAKVKQDIVKQLQLPNIETFEQSFERKNIAYSQFEVADKLHYVQMILTKNTGSSIIYARTRKGVVDWSNHLNQLGYKSTFYHGRLNAATKQENMQLWMNEEVQVMVATNAFGMGIDKANVQSVIHIDLPENIENYYQESGRAGRNGKPAHAVILYNPSDIERLKKQTLNNLSDAKFLLTFYKKMCSYLQIAYGEGLDQNYSLPLEVFCKKYQFPVAKAFACLQFLDKQNCIQLSDDFSSSTLIKVVIPPKETIRFLDNNATLGAKILVGIIRDYPGIYETPMAVNTGYLLQKNNCSKAQFISELEKLQKQQVISFLAESTNVHFKMLELREDEFTINRMAEHLKQYNTLKTEQLDAMVSFVQDKNSCLTIKLLDYFGESKKENCGICSYCLSKTSETKDITERLTTLLEKGNLNSKDIALILQEDEKIIISSLQELLESNTIAVNDQNKYYLR